MFRLSAVMLLAAAGCGPVVVAQRIALLPEKPDSCVLTQLPQAPVTDAEYKIVGTVSLVRRNYQSGVDLDEANLRLVHREACKMGGDAFAFLSQAPSGIDFTIFQRVHSPS
jgi:hypothetical protein